MKKFAFALLCILGLLSGRSSAQSMIPYGFWVEFASAGTLNTNGIPDQVRPVPIGGRMTMSVGYFGLANPINFYVPYMGFQVWDATGTTVIANMSYTSAGATVVGGPYTHPSYPGTTFINVSMNVPGGLVSGTTYKPKLTLLAPGLTLSNFVTSPGTSTQTFYTDFSTKPTLGPDVSACLVDAAAISIIPLNIAGGISGTLEYTWYLDGTPYVSASRAYTTAAVAIPLPTNTTAPGWTYTTISPDIAKLNRIVCDAKITLHVKVGGLEFGDYLFINTSPLTTTTVTASASPVCSGTTITLTADACYAIPNREYFFEYAYCAPSSTSCGPWTPLGTWQSSTTTTHTPTATSTLVLDVKYRVTVRSSTAVLSCNPVSPETIVQVSSPNGPHFFGGGAIGSAPAVKDFYRCPGAGSYTLSAGPEPVLTAPPYNGTVQWQKYDPGTSTWINISGATGLSYNAPADAQYRYIVTETHYGIACSRISFNVAKLITLPALAITTTGTTLASSPVLSISSLPAPSPGNLSYLAYTVQWYRNGVLIPGATSVTYSPTVKGRYRMTMTHTCNGSKETSNEIEIIGNCAANIGTHYNNQTITSASMTTGATYTFEGTITISGVVNFNNVRIYAKPATKILVGGTSTLNIINNSTLSGLCAGWEGILVAGQGTLNVNNSTISDAQSGIFVQSLRDLSVTNSGFMNNHVSIYFENLFLYNLSTPITITGNNFSGAALTQLDLSPLTNIDNIYSYIYVSKNIGPTSPLKIIDISANTFTGISAANAYATAKPNYLVAGHECMAVSMTGNTFTTNREGVHFESTHKYLSFVGNTFSNIPGYSILCDYPPNKNIDNRVLIRQNTFASTADKGIYLKNINGFRIKLNNFNGTSGDGILNGIECYNNDYDLVPFWYINMIAGNNFTYVDKGVIIAPVFDVFGSGDLETENIPKKWSVPARIQLMCNNFDHNDYAISGTGPMINQLWTNDEDPMNTFIDNTEWDILWFHVTSNSASPSFIYYQNPLNYVQGINNPSFRALTPTVFNGYTYPGAGVTEFQTDKNIGMFDCSRIPDTKDEDMGKYPLMKTSTAIGETTMPDNLKVYPNPVQNQFTIELDATLHANEVQVFNLVGQLVTKVSVTAGQTSIDVSSTEWTDGLYFIKLLSNNEIIATGKILKAQ